MNDKLLFQTFPGKRLKPVDGMAVTAAVWDEAHNYHREQQRFHTMLNHGPGILTGLEVIASDPSDSSIYIRPGIAIAPGGQMVLITEPLRYDLGRTSEGLLHVLLDYGESRPRADTTRNSDTGLQYVYDQFGLEASSALPDEPFVELARIRRQNREASIRDAADRWQPGPNEIDLRFRRRIGAEPQLEIALGVAKLGDIGDLRPGRGLQFLARFLRGLKTLVEGEGGCQAWADDQLSLDERLQPYTLVYLVAQTNFQLNQSEMTALYNYVQAGGTLLIESCRRSGDDLSPADEAVTRLLKSLGFQMTDLGADQNLLTEPFLFAAPPDGFETSGSRQFLVGDGVMYSTYDYGRLWQGQRRNQPPGREAIRAGLEWGSNLVHAALLRRRRIEAKG
jgi:hypothetical protein